MVTHLVPTPKIVSFYGTEMVDLGDQAPACGGVVNANVYGLGLQLSEPSGSTLDYVIPSDTQGKQTGITRISIAPKARIGSFSIADPDANDIVTLAGVLCGAAGSAPHRARCCAKGELAPIRFARALWGQPATPDADRRTASRIAVRRAGRAGLGQIAGQ